MAARKKTGRKKARTRSGQHKAAGKGSRKATRKAQPLRPSGRGARGAARRGPPSLSERLTELAEQAASGVLRTAVTVGGTSLAALLPETTQMRREAGAYVRELRELAGLTLDELAEALELSDRSVLEAVEAGTTTLSFDMALRLAAILARHDPLPVVSRLVRSSNPVLWQLLEDWGMGGLSLQFEREREFVNILRGADEARGLDDEEFAEVLAFTRAAFQMALRFARR